MKKRLLIMTLICSILLGTSACNGNTKEEGRTTGGHGAGNAVESDAPEETAAYVAANEKYGIALPEIEVFREELEYLIYWKHWSDIDSQEMECIYSYLEDCKALGKDVKLHLYYKEIDCKITDYLESNYYSIALIAPELKLCTYVKYNSRGLISDIGDRCEVPKGGFENSKKGKGYQDYGETVIHIDKEKADSFQPVKVEDAEKQKIIQQIKKEIKEYCGKKADCSIYIQDFLPGSGMLSGYVVYHKGSGQYLPYGWIQSQMLYSGKKMEKFDTLFWWERPTTAFNGGGYSRKAAKRLAQAQDADARADKCLLAYHIKGNKMTSLKGKNSSR